MILSDVSKRVIVVKGINEVRRIEVINRTNKLIMNVKNLYEDVYEIELIYRVGSYSGKRSRGIYSNE